jgi:hypothetical protein
VRTLHEHGASFTTTLQQLTDVQKHITDSLTQQRTAIGKVRLQFALAIVTSTSVVTSAIARVALSSHVKIEGLLTSSSIAIEGHVRSLTQKMDGAQSAASRLA